MSARAVAPRERSIIFGADSVRAILDGRKTQTRRVIVREVRPRSFIIENVPRILTVANGALFNAIARLANEQGYDVVAQKLDAAGYGVPQYRVRALIVGTLEGERGYQFPMPSTWALGRPARDKGWAIGREEEKVEAELAPEARFDPETRTWSVGEAQETRQQRRKRERAAKAKQIVQAELPLAEGAA